MAAPSICLDVTRLVTRAGHGPLTGIDRVELAWADRLAGRDDAIFLTRTTRGYLILGAEGAARLVRIARGEDPGHADIWSRLTGRGSRMRHRVEATLRPFAIARALPRRLHRALDRLCPGRLIYLNVGHTNLSRRVLAALPRAEVVVLIHDTIPLDHPDLSSPGVPDRFAAMLERSVTRANRIIVPSRAVAADLERHGVVVPPVVAPLGVETGAAERRPGTAERPYFVSIGTIEPRKNHTILLTAWDILASDMAPGEVPDLHIVGRRGWHAADFFRLLDSHPLRGSRIHEHGQMSDACARRLLAGARALLMPSLAEGYGLPPLEARAMGVPSFVSDLPVFKETLGPSGVYLDPMDAYGWAKHIRRAATETGVFSVADDHVPDWHSHFAIVDASLSTELARSKGGQ